MTVRPRHRELAAVAALACHPRPLSPVGHGPALAGLAWAIGASGLATCALGPVHSGLASGDCFALSQESFALWSHVMRHVFTMP